MGGMGTALGVIPGQCATQAHHKAEPELAPDSPASQASAWGLRPTTATL